LKIQEDHRRSRASLGASGRSQGSSFFSDLPEDLGKLWDLQEDHWSLSGSSGRSLKILNLPEDPGKIFMRVVQCIWSRMCIFM